MKTRINAFWNKHFGADLFPVDGTDVAIEEAHVEGLEAMGAKVETLEAENLQLKGDNQAHAELIEQLQETADNYIAFANGITEALEANNVEVAEGADVAAIVAEKINAWGATVPPATPAASTEGDGLNDAPKEATIYSDVDRRAQERFKRTNK